MEFLEYREMLPKNYALLPWDVVIIMTKKWVYVARPKPQQAESIVQMQAHDIWKQVMDLLEDDKRREEIDTIMCWFLYPEGEITTKIHDDVKPLSIEKRLKIYETVFMERMARIGWLQNRVFESRPYHFGKTTVDRSGTASYRAQIAVHHEDILSYSSRPFKAEDYEHYQRGDYAGLEFPTISLNTQATVSKGDGYAEAVVTSRLVWSSVKFKGYDFDEYFKCCS